MGALHVGLILPNYGDAGALDDAGIEQDEDEIRYRFEPNSIDGTVEILVMTHLPHGEAHCACGG